jgi:hypothetical protein
VGVGLPAPPLTATVTVNACEDVMLNEDGVTTTFGVTLAGLGVFTISEAAPAL